MPSSGVDYARPIPVSIVSTTQDGAFHVHSPGSSSPGNPVQVLTLSAVPANTTRRIQSIRACSRFESAWRAKVGVSVVAEGRTGPGHPADDYAPKPFIILGTGDQLIIEIEQAAGPTADIAAMVGGFDELA